MIHAATLRREGATAGNRVCAIVVTYNRPVLLRECLGALRGQTRPPDQILVVDNDSTDDTREMLRAEFLGVTVLALSRNGGGAGGFHAGMRWAHQQGFDWLWIMDDDARPNADCLAQLLAHAHIRNVLVPLQRDSDGRLYGVGIWRRWEVEVAPDIAAGGQPVSGKFVFRFVGPLIAREVVARVGLPNKDFFIWFDDIEYALRIGDRGRVPIVAVPHAIMHHEFGADAREVRFLWRRSTRRYYAPRKVYYGARNWLYVLTRERWDPRELLAFFEANGRALIGDIIFEPDRGERAKMRLLGILDGALGRLGKRV